MPTDQEVNLRDELIRVITDVQPNIKWKDLERMVAQLTVELQGLAKLQAVEDKE